MGRSIIFLAIAFAFSVNASGGIPIKSVTGHDIIRKKPMTADFSKAKKIKVFYFLSSSCPCSQAHFNHLNGLKEKYSQFEFYGFHSNINISQPSAEKYFEKYKVDFPIIMDKSLAYAYMFNAVKTPHVFILNSKNEIVFQGGATNSRNPKRAKKFYLKDALASLAQGETPKIANAKTIGCYIQR